jgi:hypothetical protein
MSRVFVLQKLEAEKRHGRRFSELSLARANAVRLRWLLDAFGGKT